MQPRRRRTDWANTRGDLSVQPQGRGQGPEPGARLNKDVGGDGEYTLVNRFFEATPAPVLTAALDGVRRVHGRAGRTRSRLENIQKAADEYWAKLK